MIFIEVKSLAGISYIRAEDILAVQYNDVQRSTVVLAGGITVPCAEAAKEIVARIETIMAAPDAGSKDRS
jgi:hypothetical protein